MTGLNPGKSLESFIVDFFSYSMKFWDNFESLQRGSVSSLFFLSLFNISSVSAKILPVQNSLTTFFNNDIAMVAKIDQMEIIWNLPSLSASQGWIKNAFSRNYVVEVFPIKLAEIRK